MKSLTVCRRINTERPAGVRGRTFDCDGVARSATRRLSCGFARVTRPDVPFYRTCRRRTLKCLACGGGGKPVTLIR
jgi:hypothetical protein